ncbi:MAG: hypothetical protein ACI9TH_003759 [Kiritimatiellia bacterium]|jgi:hypothetical protein
MRLEQGQVWQKGEEFIRILERERMTVLYKVMATRSSTEGARHFVSKKAFCQLIKDATLLPPTRSEAKRADRPRNPSS